MVPLALSREQPARDVRAFAACSVSLILSMTALTAAFSSSNVAAQWGVHRIHERNLFYVAPLFFVLLLLWIQTGCPRPARLSAGAVALGVALVAVLPYHELARSSRRLEVLPIVPWWNSLLGESAVPIAVAAFAGALGVAFVVATHGVARFFPFVVFLQLYVVSVAAGAQIENAARDAARHSVGPAKSWIDAAVPAGHEVVALSAIDARRAFGDDAALYSGWRRIWLNEFFNARVGRVLYVGRSLPYDLREQAVRVGAGGVVVGRGGSVPVSAEYVLATPNLTLRGVVVAHDPSSGMNVYRIRGDVIVAQATR